ncbi:MAG: NUDIX domain-containing protein [Oricola sp.]
MHVIDNIKTIHDGWGRFHLVTMRSPDGTEHRRQVEDHGDACCVLPYDPVRHVVTLVRQPRVGPLFAGADALLLEAPAGLTDGEDPADAVRREAMEETGLRLADLQPVGTMWSMPGCATERVHLYLAAYGEADRVGDGGGHPHEGEEIEVVEMPITVAARQAASGGIRDMKTVLLMQALQLRHPALF